VPALALPTARRRRLQWQYGPGDPARQRAARLDTHGQWLVGIARRWPGEREVSHTGKEVSHRGKERGSADRGSVCTAQPVGEPGHISEDRGEMRPTQSRGETARAVEWPHWPVARAEESGTTPVAPARRVALAPARCPQSPLPLRPR
jgi:hypothetical protein